jgi:hypothetical protein
MSCKTVTLSTREQQARLRAIIPVCGLPVGMSPGAESAHDHSIVPPLLLLLLCRCSLLLCYYCVAVVLLLCCYCDNSQVSCCGYCCVVAVLLFCCCCITLCCCSLLLCYSSVAAAVLTAVAVDATAQVVSCTEVSQCYSTIYSFFYRDINCFCVLKIVLCQKKNIPRYIPVIMNNDIR